VLGIGVWELFNEEIAQNENKTVVERLSSDVKLRVNQILDEIFKKYRT